MLYWFILGIIFLGIELINYNLICIWFSIGAFITMFCTGFSYIHQICIFIFFSGLSLFLIRKSAIKHITKNKCKELDRITNRNAIINEVKIIENERYYYLKVDGKHWRGISEEIFEVGDEVFVEKIVGNKLILKNKNY